MRQVTDQFVEPVGLDVNPHFSPRGRMSRVVGAWGVTHGLGRDAGPGERGVERFWTGPSVVAGVQWVGFSVSAQTLSAATCTMVE